MSAEHSASTRWDSTDYSKTISLGERSVAGQWLVGRTAIARQSLSGISDVGDIHHLPRKK